MNPAASHGASNAASDATTSEVSSACASAATKGAMHSASAAPVNLALANLPPSFAELVRGSLYAVVCADETASAVLIAGIAHRARRDGKTVHLATAALTSAPIADSVGHIERNGAISGAVVVIDHAERLLQLSDSRRAQQAAQALAHWAGARDNTVIAVFGNQAAVPRHFLNLRAASEHLSGFAQLHSGAGVLSLEFRHWLGSKGTNRRRTFNLSMDCASALVVNESIAELSANQSIAGDAVIAMRGCLNETCAASQLVDSYGAAVQAAAAVERGTVILMFGSHREFQALCDTVAAIRAIGRRGLRVVVRESGVRLRVAQSIALLRLGVSEIASGPSAAESVEKMVVSLQGSRFERRYERDVQQVMLEAKSLLAGGLLPTSEFRTDVEATIAASEPYNLGHALMRLYARPGQQMAAITKLEHRLRDTTIARNGLEIWVFLFGCDRGDVRALLDRVFAGSLTDLVSDWSVVDERSRILTALESIKSQSDAVVSRDALDLVA